MFKKYWKELTVSAVTLACTASFIYSYYTTILALRDRLQQPPATTEDYFPEDYSRNTHLNSSQQQELESILKNFNQDVFVGKEPSFVPSSLLPEGKEILDCSKSYVYFEVEDGFARYDYYSPEKLKRQKKIGTTCWTVEYKLHFPSGFKAMFNREGELMDFETTCNGKEGVNLQKHIVIEPECK